MSYLANLGHEHMASELISYLDRDGDGDIDFTEFVHGWARWTAASG